jgi:hypothetical protein
VVCDYLAARLRQRFDGGDLGSITSRRGYANDLGVVGFDRVWGDVRLPRGAATPTILVMGSIVIQPSLILCFDDEELIIE